MTTTVGLCANDLSAGSLLMGGGRARHWMAQALRDCGYTVVVGDSTRPPPADVYILDSPIRQAPDTAAPWAVMRHGDCQIAFLAHEALGAGVPLITPSLWAYEHMLGWRLPRHRVQWMSLEPLEQAAPGHCVLHVRAWDFQKDTPLAIRVMRRLPRTQFILRLQTGADLQPTPGNVRLKRATEDQASLWSDVGCLLVTSRQESFCMAAYEALGRGIPVVAHSHLGALREWSGGVESPIRFGSTEDELAEQCALALDTPRGQLNRRWASEAHDTARIQVGGLIPFIQESFTGGPGA